MAWYRFTSIVAHNAVGGSDAGQGVAVDPAGGGFWYTNSTQLLKLDSSFVQTASHNTPADDPSTNTEVNSVSYDGTKLYIGANNFSNSPATGWITEYDPSALTWIATHSLAAAHYAEGVAIRSGEFWVMYHDWPQVSRYDASWSHIADYALPGYVSSLTTDLFQGGFWSGDHLYLVRHNNVTPTTYWVYFWDGSSSFSLIEIRDTPFVNSLYCGQGISFDEPNLKAYWAQRSGASGNLIETTMVPYSTTSMGNGWTMLHSAKTAQAASGPQIVMNTTGADLIVLMCDCSAGTVTFTDSLGNTVTSLFAITTTSNRRLYAAYIKPTSTGVGHTFTASGATFATVTGMAILGSAASPLDATSSANGATQAGSITPTQDRELIVAFLCSRTAATYTIDSGFTIAEQGPFLASNFDGGALAYLTQTTAAAVNPAWNEAETVAIASFKGQFIPHQNTLVETAVRRAANW